MEWIPPDAAQFHHYRDWDENHKGVAPREFWAMAAKAGIKVPKELLEGKKKERSTGQL